MQNDIRAEVGLRIRQLRKNKGLSIEELAHLAGVHPNYLSEAECGKKNFSLTTIEKLAKALGVAVSELFSGRTASYSPKTIGTNKLGYLLRDAGPKEIDFIVRAVKFLLKRK
jgi:transcriptional regulator with XRE-family HTH domain